ncbi:hypothetical protein [Saccharopolyspora tripterygii]
MLVGVINNCLVLAGLDVSQQGVVRGAVYRFYPSVRVARARIAAGEAGALRLIRGGEVGGADERDGGDAAAAFVFGDEGVLAEVVGTASVSAEFLDQWRIPGEVTSRAWEERFGEREYVGIAERALEQLVKSSGCAVYEIDAVALADTNPRGQGGAA